MTAEDLHSDPVDHRFINSWGGCGNRISFRPGTPALCDHRWELDWLVCDYWGRYHLSCAVDQEVPGCRVGHRFERDRMQLGFCSFCASGFRTFKASTLTLRSHINRGGS